MCKEKTKETKEFTEMTAVELLKDFPKRILSVAHKLLGVKGVCLGLATWLMIIGTIETWGWVLVVLIIIFGREALTFIEKIRG